MLDKDLLIRDCWKIFRSYVIDLNTFGNLLIIKNALSEADKRLLNFAVLLLKIIYKLKKVKGDFNAKDSTVLCQLHGLAQEVTYGRQVGRTKRQINERTIKNKIQLHSNKGKVRYAIK